MAMFSLMNRRRILETIGFFTAAFFIGRTIANAATAVALQCVTTAGEPERHFAINFSGSRWTQSEPGSTADVFKTKNGTFVTVANTTSLKKDADGTVVAILPNFNPSTADKGDSGNDGKALETARVVEWKVDLIIP